MNFEVERELFKRYFSRFHNIKQTTYENRDSYLLDPADPRLETPTYEPVRHGL